MAWGNRSPWPFARRSARHNPGLEACGVDLYLDQQNIDTTTPVGKLLFQITDAFAEFERDGGKLIRAIISGGDRTVATVLFSPGICMRIPTARVGCVSIRECFFDEDELD
jgi:hypothetical protein